MSPVKDSRLLNGSLVFGQPGTGIASAQTTNLIIEQQSGDTEDVVWVLSGDSTGGETTEGAWHMTGTMIQDFDADPSMQKWSYINKGTWQPFIFTPNDNTAAPTVSGKVWVQFLGIGGDVRSRITRDLDWAIQGEPDFGTWGSGNGGTTATTPGAPPAGSDSGSASDSASDSGSQPGSDSASESTSDSDSSSDSTSESVSDSESDSSSDTFGA